MPRKSIFYLEQSSLDLIYFTFHYNQFWVVLAIGFDIFSFGKIVTAGLLRLRTIVSRIPKTNKILHSNLKFENTNILGSNIHVNILGSIKKRSVCPLFCNRLLLEDKLKNRRLWCFGSSNKHKNTKVFLQNFCSHFCFRIFLTV